jgi:hypothetical protein
MAIYPASTFTKTKKTVIITARDQAPAGVFAVLFGSEAFVITVVALS